MYAYDEILQAIGSVISQAIGSLHCSEPLTVQAFDGLDRREALQKHNDIVQYGEAPKQPPRSTDGLIYYKSDWIESMTLHIKYDSPRDNYNISTRNKNAADGAH